MDSDQRAELTEMRDAITERMHELQDKVDFGEMTDEQRYSQLQEEFGEDYPGTLANINELLHEQPKRSHLPPRVLIAGMLGIFFLGLAISSIFSFSPTAYATLSTQETIEPQLLLQAGENQRIDLDGATAITQITMSAETTLLLEDARREFTLYEDGTCTGCGQKIAGPYLITNAGDIHTTITQIGVQR